MSIIVPSNKIYKSNKSIIKQNEIRGIDFSSWSFSPRTIKENQIDTKTSEFQNEGTFLPENEVITNITISGYDLPDLVMSDDYEIRGAVASSKTVDVAFAAINPIYKTYLIELPQNPNINTYNENHIEFKYSKTITKKTKSATISFKYQHYKPPMSSVYEDRYIFGQFTIGSTTSTEDDIVLEDLPRTVSAFSGGASAEAYLENSRDPWQEFLVYNETTQKYSFPLTVLIGCWILSGATTKTGINTALGWPAITVPNATLVEYVPKSIEISLFGTQHILDLTEKSEKTSPLFSSADLSLDKNYFLQTKYIENIRGNLSNVVSNYSSGKETATLLCSVGDYYDENGNRVVSTETADKMTFSLYDEVLPLYRTPIGDAPMSMADGKPKIFKVLGSKVYFDGAVWQEISLQESGTTDYIVQNGTRGLSYALREDGGSYYCAGIGNATESEISIASIANGVPVTSVGGEAFRANQQIKSAIIPNGISRINAYAFFQSGLLSVELPDTLQYIGDVAFAESQLTKIEIPQSVSQIELGAFNHCNNLNTAIIKANIDKIEDAAFSDCHNLRTVKFPSTVKKIGKMSFMNAAFDSIELGNVQEIGESAFRNCPNLKNVNLKSCTSIGQWAFGGTNLTEIDARSVQYIGASAFNGCANLKKANIDGCIEIGGAAFAGTGLTEIVIPPNVTYLGNSSFSCPSLENVYYNATNADIPSSWVGGTPFSGAGINSGGVSIRIGKNVEKIPDLFLWDVSLTGAPLLLLSKVTFEAGSVCKEIGGSAFRQYQLSTLELPDSVEIIGVNCFASSALTNITANGVKDIGNNAFDKCSHLSSISIPNANTIGEYAFQQCSALKEIAFNNVVTIGRYAFVDCTGLNRIVLPSSLQEMATGAFYNCSGLEAVIIEEGLTTIGESIFAGCTSLRSVVIPESVTYIGIYAFSNCPITDVYYNGSAEQWSAIEIKTDYGANDTIIKARKHFAK